MLPSSHNGNDPNIVPLPFLGDLITNPGQEQDHLLPFSLINFPSSPLSIYTEEDGVVFLPPASTDYSLPDTKVDVMEPSRQFLGMNEATTNDTKREHSHKEIIKEYVPRKRSSKKDRHSKIETAQGPRDRRMRLSLDVARKFFDLQDILGFDKASKTVEWLLTQSRSAIKALHKDFSNTLAGEESNSPSECDVVSGVFDEPVDAFNDEDQPERPEDACKGSQLETPSRKARKTSSQASTRRISSTHLARESREKARARAKERTREKMLVRRQNVIDNGSKPAEIGEEAGADRLGHNNMNLLLPMQEVQAEVDESKQLQAINEQIITEESLGTTSNYLQNSGILQENQFRDFHLYVKPWEAYNNGTSYHF